MDVSRFLFLSIPAESQVNTMLAGVLLLVDPGATQGPQKLADVLTALNVDLSAKGSKIKKFLDVIDQTGVLTVTVTTPSSRVTNAVPTSGLWCTAGEQNYTVLRRVTFSVTVDDIVSSLTQFVHDELQISLDGSQFSLSDTTPASGTGTKTDPPKKVLQFEVTVTSTAMYDLTTLNRVQSEVKLSFAFPLGVLRLCFDLTPASVSLTVTPNPLSSAELSLVSLVNGTFAKSQSTPAADMPDTSSPNTDDPIIAVLGNAIRPWYLTVGYGVNPWIGPTGSISWGVGMLVVLEGKATPKNQHPQSLIIGLTYDSSTGTFAGQLLERSYFLDAANLRSLAYDARLSATNIVLKALKQPKASITDVIPEKLDLWTLLAPDGSTPPAEIPHCLTECMVSLSRMSSSSGTGAAATSSKVSRFSFSTKIVGYGDETKPSTDAGESGAAPTGFAWTGASVSATITTTTTTSGGQVQKSSKTRANLGATFGLYPPAGRTDLLPATADVTLSYDNFDGPGSWLLNGHVEDLSVGLLHSFFDKEVQSGAMAVLDKLTLKTLDITYAYTSGVASSFWLRGVLILGSLELDLSWQNVNKSVKPDEPTALSALTKAGEKDLPPYSKELKGQPSTDPAKRENQMLFEASLRASTSEASTLGSIIESIVPGAAAVLPPFVANINVDPTAAGSPLASLVYSHDSTKGSVLCAMLDIAGFSFTFVQFQTIAQPADEKAGTKAVAASTKRILRFECDKLPMIDDVPVVKELPQPFDSLEYVWITDSQTVPDQKGITKADLDNMPQTTPPITIQYKQAKETVKEADIVLAVGHHFIVSAGGKVVLDHVFGNAAAAPPKSPNTPTPTAHIALVGPWTPTASQPRVRLLAAEKDSSLAEDDASTETKPTKGAAILKVGPLSVSAISFQVASGHLLIVLDATLLLGALELSVLGFTISINLSTVRLNDLKSLVRVVESIHVDLHGLALGLERGPLTLAGVFEHLEDKTAEIYRGGIAVGFKAWQVLAVGEYKAVRATTTTSGYRAVFVYGKLDGPLVTLEFATISGVRVGFGYNYTVRMPGLNELYAFPLISDAGLSGAGNDPMLVLKAMEDGDNPFVSSREGSMWFAAGMTITAFDVVTLTAMLLFDINTAATADQNTGVVMALLADGVFQMEPLAPPDFSLFYIEVVIKIELNFIQGYIAADAALAPASHVYVPQAHLTGQASFYSWFGNNSHAGDWVVSVGGYARNYAPPSHYPSPDRLKLSFTVGDAIQIVGSGYVAVTPRCAMAGGTLHMSLDIGPVSAYADIILDAFINFKPFHFHASLSLSVGVSCSIDILFVHIHISIHLGADLVLWGPHDFGGFAHVDFWFFGFDISFGADENSAARDPVDIDAFLAMIQSPGPDSAPRPTDTASGPQNADVALHKWTVEQGLVPASTPAAAPGSAFPSTGTGTEWDVDAATLVMRVDVDFALTDAYFATKDADKDGNPVTTAIATNLGDVYAMPMHSLQKASSVLTITVLKGKAVQAGWRAEVVTKNAAPALWSDKPWNPANDPLQIPDGQQPPQSIKDGRNQPASIALVQGVRLLAPEPTRARSQIVQFDITASNVKSVPEPPKLLEVEYDDGSLDAMVLEPTEKDQKKRWHDFGNLMTQKTVTSGDVVDDVRMAVALGAIDVFEWAFRPVTAGSSDLDANGGWLLKGQSLDRLAAKLDKQFGELPMISV